MALEEESKNNPGQADYDQKFGGLVKAEEEGTVGDSSDTTSKDVSLADLEDVDKPKAPWEDNTSPTQGQPGFFVAPKRKKGPIIGLILTLLVGGGGAGFFLGPALAPIAFFEHVTDDLNDSLAALDIREGFVGRNKLPRADKEAAITGCTKLSIRCKFATISERQAAKLKAAGIDVSPNKGGGLFGKRIRPVSYTFQGTTYDEVGWKQQLDTNRAAQNAQRRANNMKFVSTSDSSFYRVLKRFGISKKPPELTGSSKDRVNALLNKAGVGDPKSLKFISAVDTDGNALTAADGSEGFMLEGDKSDKPTVYSAAEKASMETSIGRIANAKPPSKVTKASLGALSVLGYWDLACTVNNMIGAAAVAAKVANQAALLKAGMQLASMSSKLKAGDMSPEDAQALEEYFLQTDGRAQITDIAGSISGIDSNGTGTIKVNDTLATSNNPNFGKSAMDSPLLAMSTSGGVAGSSLSASQFSLGMGQNQLLAGFSGFAEVTKALVNLGDANVCKFVQNGAVRIIGTVVGIVGGVASFGSSTIVQGVISAGMMIGVMILDSVINNALSGGNLIENADLENDTEARAAVPWTGLAAGLGLGAQQRGLVPGSSEDIVAYAQLQTKTKNDYIAMESETANPLDINNQYSFLGSFSRSLLGYSSTTISPGSFINNIASVVGGGLSTLTKPYSAYAATIDESRFKKCDDSSYQAMGIDADVQCNIRYVMPEEDLKLDTDTVALYMEQSGYVEQDTVTGLPAGYTPPAPAASQGAAMDFITGTVNSFYSSRDLKGNEYAYFLDYCIYRTLPFGETYEDEGAVNTAAIPSDWITGKKCSEKGGNLSYFRIYTLDKSIQEAEDDEDYTSSSSQAAYDDSGNSDLAFNDSQDIFSFYAQPIDTEYESSTPDITGNAQLLPSVSEVQTLLTKQSVVGNLNNVVISINNSRTDLSKKLSIIGVSYV